MVLDNPQAHFNDSTASRFAKGVAAADKIVNKGLAPLKIWGEEIIDINAMNRCAVLLSLL